MQFNPDLDGAMGGASFNAVVLITSGLLLAASAAANRRSVTIANRDATNPIFINYDKGATAATTANGTILAGEAITLPIRNNIYAISTGGSVNVDVFPVED